MGGVFWNVMGCVDYSVSGSGAVRRHFGGSGYGGVAATAISVYTHSPTGDSPLMTVALPSVYTALALSGFTLSNSLR